MADNNNPIKYSDLVKPDNSVTELIQQLEKLQTVYADSLKSIKSEALTVKASLKDLSGATTENRETIKKSATAADNLVKAQERLKESQSNTGIELTKLKQIQAEQNRLTKLSIKLNKSKEGSYNKLSAQYSINKIRLNQMSDAKRMNTKEGIKLESETAKIYEKMNQLQKATGKYTLQVGNYELAANKLNETLAFLNKRQADIIATQGKQSQAYKLVQSEIDKTKQSLSNLTNEQSKSRSAWQKLGSNLKMIIGTYIGIAAAQRVFGESVGTIVDFEKQMSSLKAISGATDDEFKALEADAKRLGAQTTATATQIGQLQTEYAKLGYSTKEILAATEATILLSEATGEDVAQSAEIAGATIRAFGKDASETGHVVDVMAKSFTSSALNLERYGEAMKYVAPVSKAANVSLEQTTAMMSALADAGIHGSMAGTALRQILSKIDKSGKPVNERLKELADKGLTLADASDEVGKNAQTALLVLSENTDKVNNLTTAYENSAGAAEKMASIQRDNVAGALKLLTSAWDGFILNLTDGGTVLMDIVNSTREFVDWLSKNIETIKLLLKFMALAIVSWTSYKLAVLASRSAMILGIKSTYADIAAKGLLTVATNTARGAMLALNTAIKANPVGLLISLATTAASAIFLFGNKTKDATEAQAGLNEEIGNTNELLGKKIYEDFLRGIGKIKNELITLPDGTKKLVKSFDDSISTVDELKNKIKDLKESDLQALSTYFNQMILDSKRGIDNLEPGSLLQEVELSKIAEYESYLKVVSGEIERINKLRKGEDKGTKTDDAGDAKKIRDLQLSIMKDGQKKELAELEKSYSDKKEKFIEYGLDLKALNQWYQNEIIKINESYAEKDNELRLSIMADGQGKELALLEENYQKKKEQFEKAGLSQVELEKWYQNEILKINEKYAKEQQDKTEKENQKRYDTQMQAIEQEFDLRNSEIDIMETTEALKTKLRLQAEKDRLLKILKLNETANKKLSDTEIQTIKNTIAKIDKEISAVSDQPKDIYQMFGLNLDDDKKEAISESTSFALDNLSQILDANVQLADIAVQNSEKEVSAAQSKLDNEIEMRNQGYASNVSMAQKELDLAKKNQDKALKEQAKAQKQQAAIETLQQVGSLVTASAKIWAQLGFPWAIPALAIMWGSFAAAKIKANQVTKAQSESYGDGTVELLSGGSHQSGNDVDLGTKTDGTRRRAEGGEFFAVINKRSSRRFRHIIPDVINSLNGGTFAEKYLGAYQTGNVNLSVNNDSPDMRDLKADVREIRDQNRRKYYTNGNGETVETYKNLRRTYKN